MGSYKQTLLDILDCLICPHCKDIFIFPVIFDCGHNVCWPCADMIGSENKEGQECCPKCRVESFSWVNLTMWDAAGIVHVVTASLWKGLSASEVSSAGDSESGVGDLNSEYSHGSSCSISSMPLPPNMASTRELFIRMLLLTDGLESVDELSQPLSGSSECSKREQRSEDETSARRPLSGLRRYLAGRQCEPKLTKQSGLVFARARIRELLTHIFSDGTQGSVYQAGWYKLVLLYILESLTCPHCREIFTRPVLLDCDHSICWACAEKIGSKNKDGRRCCCCPKCGAESVTEGRPSRVNQTLLDVATVVRGHAASLGKGRGTPEACSDGDSGVGDLRSEFSVGSSWSIASMFPPPKMESTGKGRSAPEACNDGDSEGGDMWSQCSFGSSWSIASLFLPPNMSSIRELFIRMFLPTEGLKSDRKLSGCTEKEQWYKNKAPGDFTLYVMYLHNHSFQISHHDA